MEVNGGIDIHKLSMNNVLYLQLFTKDTLWIWQKFSWSQNLVFLSSFYPFIPAVVLLSIKIADPSIRVSAHVWYHSPGNTTAAKGCLIRLAGYNKEKLFPETRELVSADFTFVEKTVIFSKLKAIHQRVEHVFENSENTGILTENPIKVHFTW